MHIPDGYLSPSTCAASAAAAAPAWFAAARRLRRNLDHREAPLLAAGAAFCFAIMMLNVPIPDGTTAHAVGGTLMAIVLGPEAAVLALTVALVIQAFFFGDGGVLALGANCLNMAVILPLSGYTIYRALAARTGASSRSLPLAAAAACGAYAGINLAALAAAVELGIQPVFFHTPNGTPLYCPYHLTQTIPAMLLAHCTVAGGVEAAVTGLVVSYLLRTNPGALAREAAPTPRSHAWAWRGVALLLVLSPLGLLAPGSAFGELSGDELGKSLGYVPAGLARLGHFWTHAVLPGYQLPNSSPELSVQQALAYSFSAVLGIAAILVVAWVLLRALVRPRRFTSTRIRSGAPERVRAARSSDDLPAWLLQESGALTPCECSGRRKRPSFVEKTLADTASFVANTLFAETIARRPGLLQQMGAPAKLAVFALALLTACSLTHASLLLLLLALTLALAAVSRAPVPTLIRRIAPVLAFTGVAAIPALFNWVTPGHPVLVLARFNHPLHWVGGSLPPFLAVTAPGVSGVFLLLCRACVSMALVTLLTLTTRWNDLLAGMRVLLMPRLFVFVLGLVYRYLLLLLQTASDLFLARKSRSLGERDTAAGRRFIAASIVSLLARSHALSEEVHAAMISRGYTGEPRTLNRVGVSASDWLPSLAAAMVLTLFWLGDHLRG